MPWLLSLGRRPLLRRQLRQALQHLQGHWRRLARQRLQVAKPPQLGPMRMPWMRCWWQPPQLGRMSMPWLRSSVRRQHLRRQRRQALERPKGHWSRKGHQRHRKVAKRPQVGLTRTPRLRSLGWDVQRQGHQGHRKRHQVSSRKRRRLASCRQSLRRILLRAAGRAAPGGLRRPVALQRRQRGASQGKVAFRCKAWRL